MNIALKEAIKAMKKNEIQVGAVIVSNNKIIAKSCNNRQKKYNILGHAEIRTIIKAEKKIKDWRLDNCELYVTLYPCKMCEIIIKEARIKKVYYLIKNHNNDDNNSKKYEQMLMLTGDAKKYEQMLQMFFEKMRK